MAKTIDPEKAEELEEFMSELAHIPPPQYKSLPRKKTHTMGPTLVCARCHKPLELGEECSECSVFPAEEVRQVADSTMYIVKVPVTMSVEAQEYAQRRWDAIFKQHKPEAVAIVISDDMDIQPMPPNDIKVQMALMMGEIRRLRLLSIHHECSLFPDLSELYKENPSHPQIKEYAPELFQKKKPDTDPKSLKEIVETKAKKSRW